MKDLMNAIEPRRAISPAAAVTGNTPIVSEVIDRQGYESLTFLILTGALADTDATFTVSMEHDDAAAFTSAAAVPASALLGTTALAGFTFADDNKVRKIGYAGSKRYVRLTVTPANNAAGAYVAAVAVLGHPHVSPSANPPA